MDRRGFIKDVARAGIGLGAPGSILGPCAPAAVSAGLDAPFADAVIASAAQAASPMTLLDGDWLLATGPCNVGRELRAIKYSQ